jgi:hypothetical protein
LAGTGGEGMELHNMFGRYRVGQRIQIADDLTLKSSGLWRIERIELSRSKSSPYRVSLALKRIEIRK